MEATAVSLARSVLHVVVTSAGSAVTNEVAQLLGVPEEVEYIRSELEAMKAFLEVASSAMGRNVDAVRRAWVKQVREVAYDVEDCLLDFALYAARTASSRAGSWRPGALAERHRIAARIRILKATVVDLNTRNQRYHIAGGGDVPARRAGEQQAAALVPGHDAQSSAELAFQESDFIGRQAEKTKLSKLISSAAEQGEGQVLLLVPRKIWWSVLSTLSSWVNYVVPGIGLARRRAPSQHGGALRVVAVFGMGGMGKSSLVWTVHNDPVLIDEFDIGVWVTVPHPLDNPEVFKRLLRKELGVAREQNLDVYLRDKRFRIVVDDVQSREEWDHVRNVFHFENNKGSRIIVTTRLKDVARHCAREGNVAGERELVFERKPMDNQESMDLFCRKVYKTPEHTLPEDMVEPARQILSICDGLPLAISTIGGLLANRPKTSIEWRNLLEHIGAVLETDLPNIPKVIVSSYHGLPYDLKSIFLYISIFPENHEIRRTRLLRRWMAEGYIARNRDMRVENVGDRFYRELINRSMIQPFKFSSGDANNVVRCQIHSMMRYIILSRSIEENHLFVIKTHSYEVPQSKIRHLVIDGWKGRHVKLQGIDLSYVRSLTIFGECPVSLISPEMQLLRVLDLEDTVNLQNDDLKHIGELLHLRYLSLRGTDISKIPSSLKNLRYLETLDIQGTKVTQLPSGIVKLEKLRYLLAGVNFTNDLLQKMRESGRAGHEAGIFGLCSSINCCNVMTVCHYSLRAPEGIEKLRNLHMLGVVDIGKSSRVAGRLWMLKNLQRLGVTGLTEKAGNELCYSIRRLSRLQQLELRSDSLKFLGELNESHVPDLVSLRLCGNLTRLPEWIKSLNNLAKVKLLGTRLEEGDIASFQNLRNLALLCLWENSYIGEALRFRTGTFPKLKLLDIDGLDTIKKVKIQEKAMPKLEQLWVNKCPSLHDDRFGLSGVPYLPSLNELRLKNCGDKEDLINILQGQVNSHKKRPKFLIGRSIVPANMVLPSNTTTEQ